MKDIASFEYFEALDIRIGKIVKVEDAETKKPTYRLTIDFGPEIGTKRSSVQIVKHYRKEELVGKKVLGVVNFPARQIGPFLSEVLTLGVPDENHECILIVPDKDVAIVGGRLY